MVRRKPPPKEEKRRGSVSSLDSARETRRERYIPPPDGRPTLLTKERSELICRDISQGCFLHVAAKANGISVDTLESWKRDGRKARTLVENDPLATLTKRQQDCLKFLSDVERAEGEARKGAEIRVRSEDPKFWLRVGPGRDRGPTEPGWTDSMQIAGANGGPLQLTIEDLVKHAAASGDE